MAATTMTTLASSAQQITLLGHHSPAWLTAAAGSVALISVLLLLWRASRLLRGKKAADTFTVVAAAMASSVSATGMWHFFSRTMHLPLWVQTVLFAFMEVSVLASALRARANVARDGNAGADGLAVWVLTCASGLMSASEAGSPQEALVRLGAPLVAAWLWERSMVPERRAQRAARARTGDRSGESALSLIMRAYRGRLLALLGAVTPDRSALEIRRDKAQAKFIRLTRRIDRSGILDKLVLPRVARRREAALLASGAPQDECRQLQIVKQLAAVQHLDDLRTQRVPSPWEAHAAALAKAAEPQELGEGHDRAVTARELPSIVAAAVALAQRAPEPEPAPEDRPITARELPGIFGTAFLLGMLHADRPTANAPADPALRVGYPTDYRTTAQPTADPTLTYRPAIDPTPRPTPTRARPAANPGKPTDPAPTVNGSPRPRPGGRTPQELHALADKARTLLGPGATAEAIRDGLHISQKYARQVRDILRANPTATWPTDPDTNPESADPAQTDPADPQSTDQAQNTDPTPDSDPADRVTQLPTRPTDRHTQHAPLALANAA